MTAPLPGPHACRGCGGTMATGDARRKYCNTCRATRTRAHDAARKDRQNGRPVDAIQLRCTLRCVMVARGADEAKVARAAKVAPATLADALADRPVGVGVFLRLVKWIGRPWTPSDFYLPPPATAPAPGAEAPARGLEGGA